MAVYRYGMSATTKPDHKQYFIELETRHLDMQRQLKYVFIFAQNGWRPLNVERGLGESKILVN